MSSEKDRKSPMEMLTELGAVFSPDFDRFIGGDTSNIRCALCKKCPCQCPEFGTQEYFDLIDKVHGKGRNNDKK